MTLATESPIEQRIVFKLCLLMHQVHTGRAPCVTASADMTLCPRLRSTSSQRYDRTTARTRLKLGWRTFIFPVPDQEPGTVCRHHCTKLTDIGTFKRHLKLFFFQQVYE